MKAYGEAEFWLSGGKFLLIVMLFAFTLVTMAGGNPHHDVSRPRLPAAPHAPPRPLCSHVRLTHVLQAYGFRHWQTPGAFAEYATRSTGGLGRFEGFLACLWSAAFCIVGPEYISIVAAEAKRPSVYIKAAFKTVYWRFGIFFIMGALCVGIVIPFNDPKLVAIYFGGASKGTAASSPYVIAMSNMGIKILPDIVNALMLTSIFSAGNTYTVSLAPADPAPPRKPGETRC